MDLPIQSVELDIPKPNLNDLRSDLDRFKEALHDAGYPADIKLPYEVLETFSNVLREQNWSCTTVIRNNEVTAILPKGTLPLGLAVDVGTTKVAAYLINMDDGSVLTRQGAMNPQVAYGEDVISRIHYANHTSGGAKILQSTLIDTLNRLVEEMCASTGNSPGSVVEAVIAGNTAMHHLVAGLPVKQLGFSPYVPAVNESLEVECARIGLKLASGAKVFLPPNIAGFVGADHVAMLLSTGAAESSKNVIALDIGTNTEISLVTKGQITCCSCASGPAFEGAHIKDGMRAAPGAVERVWIAGEDIRVRTIDDAKPVGICGSGILDAVAELLGAGALDSNGSFRPGHPLVRAVDGKREALLVPAGSSGSGQDITVTRKDINEIQLAKGAIRAGIDVLLEDAGLSADSIDEFIVAGAFGTYLDISSAIKIGMFPSLPLSRFQQVGNAAGAGAVQMLVSKRQREKAASLAVKLNYIELTTNKDFRDIFFRGLLFSIT
ncbi:MAG: DUF4445 domain-containing protein [Chloroflexi bacterium]|nr:MAG: DUF4445 domain-containing protein [Chloroflexota bacterium]